jgi:hypothetical protein
MIRYTCNLLQRLAAVNWDEAYHYLINQGAANRDAGNPVNPDQLDPHWMSWDTVSNLFRSSFGDKVTTEEEVAKWDNLAQTVGFDNFLD